MAGYWLKTMQKKFYFLLIQIWKIMASVSRPVLCQKLNKNNFLLRKVCATEQECIEVVSKP